MNAPLRTWRCGNSDDRGNVSRTTVPTALEAPEKYVEIELRLPERHKPAGEPAQAVVCDRREDTVSGEPALHRDLADFTTDINSETWEN